jgi:hypothetical protein
MESRLTGVLSRGVSVHLDDVFVYAETRRECEHLTGRVETMLNPWRINEAKSLRCVQEATYCGWRYGHGRITNEISPKRPIETWPVPTNAKELRCNIYLL